MKSTLDTLITQMDPNAISYIARDLNIDMTSTSKKQKKTINMSYATSSLQFLARPYA